MKIYDGRKLLRTLTASDRNDDGRLTLSYRLPKKLKVGKHTITLKFLPASSTDASTATHTTTVRVRSGDLIWTPGHVAIYIGNGKQIDAPRPGKSIKVRSIWQSNPTFLRV